MGHQIYLRLKRKGDNSMSGKRMESRSRLALAPQDPGDMVKPGLVKPQNPCCKVEQAGYNGCISGCLFDAAKLSQLWQRIPERPGCNEQPQGFERGTYIALLVHHVRKTGSPKGRESYGDGDLIVVRDGESPLHGEGGQVFLILNSERYAKCRTP
ncbi:hypothetical protein Pan153_53470 [Gimesia panareensis]|uniref:Uncharacterized protein n=1 Tax=Gimesia panareensis TaxID=2527978 RepID=A0A518FWI2_9PLAN|nr:hypothetical protein Pan153_53470 [Gimesia panareensis]